MSFSVEKLAWSAIKKKKKHTTVNVIDLLLNDATTIRKC